LAVAPSQGGTGRRARKQEVAPIHLHQVAIVDWGGTR
jgi:hypothetical protein